MRYLDRIDAGLPERLSDRAHMIDTVHVADGVHAVAQRHILDVELVLADVEAHDAALRAWMRCASSSPVDLAAAAMLSSLPESLGRSHTEPPPSRKIALLMQRHSPR